MHYKPSILDRVQFYFISWAQYFWVKEIMSDTDDKRLTYISNIIKWFQYIKAKEHTTIYPWLGMWKEQMVSYLF